MDEAVDALRERYEERAAILEYDAGYQREEAELIAREMVYGEKGEHDGH